MTWTVRTATPEDFAQVDALLARAYPRLLKADYPPSVLVTALPLISRAQPALLRTGTYFVVCDEAATIVGAGGWTPDRKIQGLGHIRHVVTDDRLQRAGVGRTLLVHIIDTARAAGISQLECWSTFTAVRFYEAMGFAQVEPIDVPLRQGISFPSVRMLQTLD